MQIPFLIFWLIINYFSFSKFLWRNCICRENVTRSYLSSRENNKHFRINLICWVTLFFLSQIADNLKCWFMRIFVAWGCCQGGIFLFISVHLRLSIGFILVLEPGLSLLASTESLLIWSHTKCVFSNLSQNRRSVSLLTIVTCFPRYSRFLRPRIVKTANTKPVNNEGRLVLSNIQIHGRLLYLVQRRFIIILIV